MDLGRVYHRTTGNYCYPLNEEELVIFIKTGYDVDKVYLHYGDPFEQDEKGNWSHTKLEMIRPKKLPYHLGWQVIVKPSYKRCKYYFELEGQEEVIYFFEDAFVTREEFQEIGQGLQYFVFPWMNTSDIIRPPTWVKDTIWYQIFPERFCNGNPKLNPKGTKEWKSEPIKEKCFYGGDLEGISSKIPYLHNLGITGIYLTPIFKSPSHHKYDTQDYLYIDEAFGDEEIWKEAVDKAHHYGIRVMMDMVFNHSGKTFGPWQDVLKKGKASIYYNWFIINEWPLNDGVYDTKDGKYASFAFSSNMPKLNTNNEEVVKYLLDVCSYWVGKFGIDGLRFDVGDELSHQFCKRLHHKLKIINPEIYLLGEMWHDAINWLGGDEYDGVMNYPFMSTINRFWLDESLTKDDFEKNINECFTHYPLQSYEAMYNLLDSHDTDRLMTRLKGNEKQFYQQLVLLLAMPGSPSLYYGTEIGLMGSHDPDCRRCMPWDEIKKGKYKDQLGKIKTLIQFRKQYTALTSNDYFFKDECNNERLIHLVKQSKEGSIEIYLNCSKEAVTIPTIKQVLFSSNYIDGILKSDGVVMILETKN